ncbi:MAG: universal stress protein [Blastocatellia bacterium]
MNRADSQLTLERIFHPTDFSETSAVAFAHALKLATLARGRLTVLHTDDSDDGDHWEGFPGIRQTLEQWGLLPESSSKEDLAGLGLEVEKIAAVRDKPVESILHYLRKHPHDLIVLATYQHDGLERWIRKAVAEPVARRSDEMTLFIPHGVSGFVSVADGAMNLRQMLIPVDDRPRPQAAIAAAMALAELMGEAPVTFTLLYVGELDDFPIIRLTGRENWQWKRIIRTGGVEQQILRAANEIKADLIVMATEGHHGFLDALRGSTTERIVRSAECPVLAVPAEERPLGTFQELFAWQPSA